MPTIGVLAGWQLYRTATNLSYLLPVFDGIHRAAREFGCNLLLGCGMGASASPDDPHRPAWPLWAQDADFVPIGPSNTDGLIVFTPLHSQQRTQYVRDVMAAGHPVLFVGSGEPGPTIAADNHGGVAQAIAHLAAHGHQRIAFIAGSSDDLAGDSGERLAAYRAAMSAHSLALDERLVAFGQHVYSGGQSAMRHILDAGQSFTAVLASNDESALGAMQALRAAGRCVPRDVAVIGFDNRLEGAAETPSLSSVHVPLFDLGYRAVAAMLDLIKGQPAPRAITRVPTRLVARDSCGCGHPEATDPKSATDNAASAQAQSLEGLAAAVMHETQHLQAQACIDFCRRLQEAFAHSAAHGESSALPDTLAHVLQYTAAGDDDAHVWQRVITHIASDMRGAWPSDSAQARRVDALVDRARQAISAASLHQHRQHAARQRHTSSRLSLLTAALQTTLDESQVFAQLAQHLPALDIDKAWLALFDADAAEPHAWSTLHDVTAPSHPPVRFRTDAFMPDALLADAAPFRLALIPLVNATGQLGYAIFGTEHLDVYGAIVQQVGGALNTARLYREATEGRRLAEASDQMKSRFLSTISHELRTPLNLIVGLSDMLLRSDQDGGRSLPASTQQDVERIHAYSLHLGGLIGDVLDLATSDAGQLRLNNGVVDLGQVLRIAADSGRQLATDKGLAWSVDLPERGPWLWGDATRLRQVALNLISNAVKYTERGGISLRLQVRDNTAQVTVSDTGLGIALDEQEAIFDEFHQAERTVSQGYAGMGLGLSISKRLVEMHGGTIGVRSSGERGAGSTFHVVLPTIQPPASATEQSPAGDARPDVNAAASKQQLWLITSQPADGAAFSEQLRARGVDVQVVAPAALAALAAAQQQRRGSAPDVVLLDARLAPDQSAQALAALQHGPLTQGVPVLFYELSADQGAGLDLDALTRPAEVDAMLEALDQPAAAQAVDAASKTVLIVDDDPRTVDMHARMVQSHSPQHRILKAHGGREALALLGQEHIDLVLLDLTMPEMDGFGVLDAMRSAEVTRHTPVIVVTGQALTGPAMQRLTQGVAIVLNKGLFSLDETLTHIDAALARNRKRGSQSQRVARQALVYIHEHYAEQITRESLARHLAVSEDYLTVCFRKEMGTTPIAYLNRFRVNQAKTLLGNNALSVTEVAMAVGFSDSGYFSRVFRQKVGVSPDAFRQSADVISPEPARRNGKRRQS